MASLSTFFTDKAWAIPVALIVILLGLALVVLVYRSLRGGRIGASSTRGRQQRLGVVDTHDIGGDRQLIIIRRDNVEHLIMTGGPNDVVIESSILRAEGRSLREREPGAPSWAASDHSPSDQRPAAPELAPSPPEEIAPQPPLAPTSFRQPPKLPDLFARVRRPASEPRPAESTPERTTAEPVVEAKPAAAPESGQPAPPVISDSPLRPEAQEPSSAPTVAAPLPPADAPPVAPRAPLPPLTLRPAPPRPMTAAPSPTMRPAPPPLRPAPPPLRPVTPPPPPPPPPQAEAPATEPDPLASLEEEMAKLLGRPGPGH